MYICPPHLYTVATLPWEIQKRHFSTVLSIHTDYLCNLRRKQTVSPLSSTPEKCHPTTIVLQKKQINLSFGCDIYLTSQCCRIEDTRCRVTQKEACLEFNLYDGSKFIPRLSRYPRCVWSRLTALLASLLSLLPRVCCLEDRLSLEKNILTTSL